jgi:hypothetical protein
MTVQHDFDRLIATFLEDGPSVLPDRSYDAVRAVVDQTRQRVVIGPWRIDQVTRYATYGIAAAAVVLITVLGIQLLPGNGGVGVQPTPTATATPQATPAPTSEPTPEVTPALPTTQPLPVVGPLAAGTYVIDDPGITRAPFTLTIPEGWHTSDGFISKGGTGGQLFSSEAIFGPWIVENVFADACDWAGTLESVTTAAEIVEALERQEGRDHSTPRAAVVGDQPATLITLSNTGCNDAAVRNWPDPGPDASGGWRSIQGQRDLVFVVDLPEGAQVIVASEMPGATEAAKAELSSIVESIEFGT